MKRFQVIRKNNDDTETVLEETNGIVIALTTFRSAAFDIAASGKHGDYSTETGKFNDEVEEGFNDDGSLWEAKDGTVVQIVENKKREH